MINDHSFCRALLRTTRQELTSEQRRKLKGAWVWRDGDDRAEFQVPSDGYYWYGSACCSYLAKYNGIGAWLERNYPEEE